MVNWQITAATFHCDTVNDDVTVMVRSDWSVQRTGQAKYAASKRRNGRNQGCQGTGCKLASAYRTKLQEEEAGKVTGGRGAAA